MREKPITPYARLLADVRKFASSVKYPHKKLMWRYNKSDLGKHWTLTDLYERVKAADQLGYDVVLVAEDAGLAVQYAKRPDVPWDWA